MKIVEFQQRAEDGGFPTPNETGFEHGELIVVLSKRELREFLDKTHLVILEFMPGLKHMAYSRIKELNEQLIELDQARHKLKDGQ